MSAKRKRNEILGQVKTRNQVMNLESSIFRIYVTLQRAQIGLIDLKVMCSRSVDVRGNSYMHFCQFIF